MSRMLTLAALASAAAFASLTLPATAGDIQGDAYDCAELWTMKNEICKAGGYCFKSPRAISRFGNAGCMHDREVDVPLSDTQRMIIRDVKRSQKRQHC